MNKADIREDYKDDMVVVKYHLKRAKDFQTKIALGKLMRLIKMLKEQ